MHYGSTSFSYNGSNTMVSKIKGITIGQRAKLSPIDIAEIRKYYKC